MKKLYAILPNITIEKSCQYWDISFVGIHNHFFKETGDYSVVVQLNFENNTQEKTAMRQLKVLRNNLMVAAFLLGEDPLVCCKVLKWQEGIYAREKSISEHRLPLNLLAKHLPLNLEVSARTISWFSRYLELPKWDEGNRIMSLYNALGTLPSGFNGILTTSTKQEDKLILKALLERIQDFHNGQKEDENYVAKTLPFSVETISKLEKLYIRLLFIFFPEFK